MASRRRRKITNYNEQVLTVVTLPLINDNTVFAIAIVYPLKTFKLKSILIQGSLCLIQCIKVFYHLLYAFVHIILKQVPVEAGIVIPFRCLAKLATHKQQLRARMSKHITKKRSNIGEALPFIARHASHQ